MADSPFVTVPVEPTEEMIDAGLRVTMQRLSLPGSQLTQNREKMRLRYKAMCDVAPETKVMIEVPDADFRITSPEAQAVWDFMGVFITNVCEEIGEDLTFSIILSRLTRELRRAVGKDAAREVLRGMLATMSEAAQYDR